MEAFYGTLWNGLLYISSFYCLQHEQRWCSSVFRKTEGLGKGSYASSFAVGFSQVAGASKYNILALALLDLFLFKLVFRIITTESPKLLSLNKCHRVKSSHIRSFSDPYFPAFGLNTERIRIQSECLKIRPEDTFHSVITCWKKNPKTIKNHIYIISYMLYIYMLCHLVIQPNFDKKFKMN